MGHLCIGSERADHVLGGGGGRTSIVSWLLLPLSSAELQSFCKGSSIDLFASGLCAKKGFALCFSIGMTVAS